MWVGGCVNAYAFLCNKVCAPHTTGGWGSRIACDVGFNNMLAVHNTRLLQTYMQIDERVRPLIFAVKHWAKARRINEPYAGTLSRYDSPHTAALAGPSACASPPQQPQCT
jgi:hypothetical protein